MSRSVSCQSPDILRRGGKSLRFNVSPQKLNSHAPSSNLGSLTRPTVDFTSKRVQFFKKHVYVYKNKSSSLYAIYIRLISACLDEHFHFLVQEVAVGKMLAKQHAT